MTTTGWQDTDFVPEDCAPAEWVAKMNEGDPQIEYRVVSVVDGCSSLSLEQKTLVVTYDEFCALLYALGVQIVRDSEVLALPFFVDVDERACLVSRVERSRSFMARLRSGVC